MCSSLTQVIIPVYKIQSKIKDIYRNGLRRKWRTSISTEETVYCNPWILSVQSEDSLSFYLQNKSSRRLFDDLRFIRLVTTFRPL